MNSRNPDPRRVWNGALRSRPWLHFRVSVAYTGSAGSAGHGARPGAGATRYQRQSEHAAHACSKATP